MNSASGDYNSAFKTFRVFRPTIPARAARADDVFIALELLKRAQREIAEKSRDVHGRKITLLRKQRL